MFTISAQPFQRAEINRWQKQAQQVTIIRDKWGIPHIYGKTDADVVFGALYAQCEDDFARVEMNYIDATGRMAEVLGEVALYHDLRARMFLDSVQAVAIYRQSPAWMKKLLNAFADGINYYLYTHPEIKPTLITRFQPWMPLMFSEGSIGGNISAISLSLLQAFYEQRPTMGSTLRKPDFFEEEPVGSNGFAIGPSKSATGNALLLINPHTSFYFRSELQMISQEGLNAYGAVTWGQFFIYQGFNEYCGWMHTSSNADSIDEYLETIEKRDGKYFYKYGREWRPLQTQQVVLPYKTDDGIRTKSFTIYRTHHGPVIREQAGKWVTIRMMNEPLKALTQSYLRTKAKGYQEFSKIMELRTNSSNNTVFADRDGNIAYWHGNFMPRREPYFNWSNPVDGSDPRTEWQGLHEVKELVQVFNPPNGWIQNCNSTPFTAAGEYSPKLENYFAYMAPDVENYRGINAVRVLDRISVFTLDSLIAAAYDPYLAGLERLIPSLLEAYDRFGNRLPIDFRAIETLRNWDFRCGKESVATTLAIDWGERMQVFTRAIAPDESFDPLSLTEYMIKQISPEEKLNLFIKTLDGLRRNFGDWRVPWGETNRFQRLTGKVQETFDDDQPSLPVGFASANWGSLASYGMRGNYRGLRKRYGTYGNSFVAVVEFGPRLQARAVVTGGSSSDPNSPHFNDQAALYCDGQFRPVWFYPEEVQQNAERRYQPGK